MKLPTLLFALQQIAAPAPAPAVGVAYPGESAPSVAIPRIDVRPTIDGRLDESAWAEAARLTGFWQYEPVDGRAAEEETEVLVWYSPDAIHFGIIARDRQPEQVRATIANRDAIDGDDHVVIYLDTFNDRRRAFFFAVNPLGVQQDGVRTEGAAAAGRTFGGETDKSPDFWFESKGHLTEEGYVVEVRIPFKSLRYPGGEVQRWGLQVERKVQRTGHSYTWTAARRASASFLSQGGILEGMSDLKRGIVIETQPFVTATAPAARDGASGDWRRESLDPQAGVNLHVGFTNLALDATINPDFSQVEADAGQVTVNERFAPMFTEKRPFFLDGIELFSTPNQLVHTRQIVRPRAGGKVTGKLGGISVAHLTALDRGAALQTDDALFNLTRLRRDFAANSHMGVTYTDRTLQGGGESNRVLAADVRHVFGRIYFAEAQLGRSWTKGALAGEGSDLIWRLTLDRTGKYWGFNYQLNGIGEGFHSGAGFVPRVGFVEGMLMNRVSWYGAQRALLERITVYLRPSRIWGYDRFGRERAIEGGESANFNFRLRGGWEIRATPRRNFYTFDPAAYTALWTREDGVMIPYQPLDSQSGAAFELGANTPAFRLFDASASLVHGRAPLFREGADGNSTQLQASLALRPSETVRIGLSHTAQRLERVRDGSDFARTGISRLKAELQPSRAFSFRAVGEYRAERRAALQDARTGTQLVYATGEAVDGDRSDAVRIDLLLSYQPVPGTVAFLGYGSSLTGEEPFSLYRLERQNDGFFVKLAYRFRR